MTTNIDILPIYERFYTFQGEGVHMGRTAFFIRTYGCPVHCPWCDSAGTWHPKHVPKNITKMGVLTLADEAFISSPEFVVITGGEPAVHDLRGLTSALRTKGLPVHIETSGAFPLQGRFDWVTLSPKRWKLPLPQVIQSANEFKLIIEKPEDIAFYTGLIEPQMPNTHRETPIWLHPEWSQRKNEEVLEAICNAVKNSPGRYRAGWQLHKLYQVDKGDFRSRPLVPLGGDPGKGF